MEDTGGSFDGLLSFSSKALCGMTNYGTSEKWVGTPDTVLLIYGRKIA